MSEWVKTARVVNGGCTTNIYWLKDTPYTIESRKRAIPHANRGGTWDFTSYFVLKNNEELVEKNSLKDAKAYAEEMNEKEADLPFC